MDFALTTRWNAHRHTSGEQMIEEILEMGFDTIELGYDTRMDLVPGITDMVKDGAVRINSLHNFCPVPMGAPRGHPELYTFASLDPRERELAVTHTGNTIRFAAELGARVVVSHSGNVKMNSYTRDLIDLAYTGQGFSVGYEKLKFKCQNKREKRGRKQIAFWYQALERLLPLLEETGIVLAIENLPTWEAVPTEIEMEEMLRHFNNPHIRCWHDIGHGQIRENLGFINHYRWFEKLLPYLAGMHLHDVIPPAQDHAMPPAGHIDFQRFRDAVRSDIVRVVEPTTRTPKEEVLRALAFFRETFEDQPQPNGEENHQESL